jgi:hypothetical protein
VSAPSERESERFLREHPVLHLLVVACLVSASLTGDWVAGALFLGLLLWWSSR